MKSVSLYVSITTLLLTNTLALVDLSSFINPSPWRFRGVGVDCVKNGVLKRNGQIIYLYRSVQEAIEDAEHICSIEGSSSERCKVAWDIVEELQAADSHKRKQSIPDDLSYYPLLEGFDLLSMKVDKQLNELRNLSAQLAEAGAGFEVERLVYASDEMKQVLDEARAALIQYR